MRFINDKWLIIRNEENADILNNWSNRKFNNSSASLKGIATFFSDKLFTAGNRKFYSLYYREIFIEEFLEITSEIEQEYTYTIY